MIGADAVGSRERPRKNDCVVEEMLADGSMVLYHSCLQQILTLNPTAALIWECCDGAHSLVMIAQELREVFPAVSGIDDDVLATVLDFIERGMVVDDNL
jgi:hypothetical protein